MSARTGRSWVLLVPIAIVLLCVAFSMTVAARPQNAVDKSVFLSALEESGKPVRDLTTADIRIREDGADREVTEVRPAAQPLQLELLGDTTANAEKFTRDIRVSCTAFVKQVLEANPNAQISIREFGQAAVTVTPFTTDAAELEKGIIKLIAKPRAASVLLEALIAASNSLAKRPSPRRAIVALNIEPSDEQSREDPKKIDEALRKSGAQLWAVSLQNGALKNPTRDVVLNTLTKNSGGQREFIVGQSALETVLKGFADALTSQYEVVYKRPSSARSAKVVQTGTTRQGLKLHASFYAPE
jgi:hypothetical protein